MKLPQLVDYQTALQIPQVSFADEDLKRGQVQLNQLKVPDPASGGFALTFAVTANGQRYAVRCFHKLGNHLQERYAEIAEFIRHNQRDMEFLTDVRYVPEGILVNGNRFPIVRMPWVSGKRLDSWIDGNLRRPELLSRVREQLQNAVTTMRAAGVAHGDLQHGNILVDDTGRIRLIDYDGMYLPALAELGASESGHRNYQHPDRGHSYHADLDLFSAAVIDLSLDAVRLKPQLWHATGENLLFEIDDFLSPRQSQVFGQLTEIPELRDRARRLMDACLADFASVPGILSGRRPSAPAASAVPPAARRARTAGPRALSCEDRTALLARDGDVVPVVGRVTGVHAHHSWGKTTTFINFGDYRKGSFTIVAFDDLSRELATEFGERCAGLKGKWVTITDLVGQYRADSRPVTPQIVLRRLGSLRILSAQQARALLAEPTEKAVPDATPTPPPTSTAPPADPPTSGTYRWSARPAGTPRPSAATSSTPTPGTYRRMSLRKPSAPPDLTDPLVDDVAIRASRLYNTPGFAQPTASAGTTGPIAPPPAAATPPQPPQPAQPSQPPWPAQPSRPPRPVQPSWQAQQPQAPPPQSWPPQMQPPRHQPTRRGFWRWLRDRLSL